MAEEDVQSSRHESQSGENSRGHSGEHPEAHPQGQDDILRTLTAALQRIAENVPPLQPSQLSIVKEVHKYRAEEFRGREDDDPTRAEYWLEQLERIFGFMNPTPEEKLQGAVALLNDEAYRWWASVLQVKPLERVNWEFFVKEFRKRYVGEQYMEDKRREFLQLTQGGRTVQQYETEFRRLSRYAREIMVTDDDMCRKFRSGLRTSIQKDLLGVETSDLTKLSNLAQSAEHMAASIEIERNETSQGKRSAETSIFMSDQPGKKFRDSSASGHSTPAYFSKNNQRQKSGPPSQATTVASTGGSDRVPTCAQCGRRHLGECWRTTGACYRCGSKDHYLKDCPKAQTAHVASSARSEPTLQRGRRPEHGFGTRKSQSSAQEKNSGAEQRAPARIYAIRAQEDQDTQQH